MADQEYELFAVRYATRDARRSDHFIGGDPHDGPMPMDYFMWLARGGGRTFVIDTGFNAEIANKRKRTFLRCASCFTMATPNLLLALRYMRRAVIRQGYSSFA